MIAAKIALVLLLVLQGADARVAWKYAEMFDPVDLVGVQSVQIKQCSSGCYVFASIPKIQSGFESKVFVASKNKDQFTMITNIKDLSEKYDNATSRIKGFIELPAGDNYYLYNGISPDAPPTIVVYVVPKVQSGGTSRSAPVIYDQKVSETRAGTDDHITIMSAEHYELANFYFQRIPRISIFAAGQESLAPNFWPDRCNPIYQQMWTGDMSSIRIRSPLITVVFNAAVPFTFTTRHGIHSDVTVLIRAERPSVSMSWGHIGCNKVQPFRWYPQVQPVIEFFLIDESRSLNIDVIADVNLVQEDCVKIVPLTAASQCLSGSYPKQVTTSFIERSSLAVSWTPKDNFSNSSFAIRIEPHALGTASNSLPRVRRLAFPNSQHEPRV